MSSDGAHLGVDAERALKTILSGEPSPGEDERMDAETFRTWIKTCPADVTGYGETARLAAHYLLEYLTAHPDDMRLPLDDSHDFDRAKKELGHWPSSIEELQRYRTTEGLWDRAVAEYPALHALDLTGFMAGWAFNAARRCLELPPAANGALLTIEVPRP